jgi:Mn2+/Fe2+ NRAMP family transporter
MTESTGSLEVSSKPGVSSAFGMELLPHLGPGLLTGAADDDPSGVATYSQVGMKFGMALLWTMVISYPLMAATQEICARVGRITGVGIAENLRRHYPKTLGYSLIFLFCIANLFNLAADIAAMGAATALVVDGPRKYTPCVWDLFLLPFRCLSHIGSMFGI